MIYLRWKKRCTGKCSTLKINMTEKECNYIKRMRNIFSSREGRPMLIAVNLELVYVNNYINKITDHFHMFVEVMLIPAYLEAMLLMDLLFHIFTITSMTT